MPDDKPRFVIVPDELDERGDRTGQIVPSNRVRGGLLVDELVERGLTEYDWPPTSGNAWARSLLDELLPMPEAEYLTCPDIYLGALARLYGRIEVIAEPQSLYRVHGRNNVNTISYEEERRRLDHVYEALNARLRERGVHVDVESWRADSWVHRLHRAEHAGNGRMPSPAICFLCLSFGHDYANPPLAAENPRTSAWQASGSGGNVLAIPASGKHISRAIGIAIPKAARAADA